MNKYLAEVIVQSGIHNIAVCEENKRIFRLENKHNYFIQKIRVDNGLIKSGIRCDYAIDVYKDAKPDTLSDMIYLIELKGSDKDHACEQIIQTYNYFIKNFKTIFYHCRIVLSKDTAPKLLTTNQKKLKQLEKQKKLDILIKSQKIEEVL